MLFLGRLSERKFTPLAESAHELSSDIRFSLAEDYNLEQLYRKPFAEVWTEEKDKPVFKQLSERMSVRGQGGELLVSDEEMDAAGK